MSLIVKCLNVSQSTAVERKDCEIAISIQASENAEMDISAVPNVEDNNGTNACVFLALHVRDTLSQKVKEVGCLLWDDLVKIGEETISLFPVKINTFRDVSETYHAANAKAILTSNNLFNANYELSEECISWNGVFTDLGRREFFDAMNKQNSAAQVGLYTYSPYTFLVGTNSGSFFLIDTHPIKEDLGGNGNGILVATNDTSETSCKLLVQWILKRLKSSGVSGSNAKSLVWLTEIHDLHEGT